MTNKELEKKIEELSAQIEALKGEMKKETPKGEIWKPKVGKIYYYIDYAGNVFSGECYSNVELVAGNMYPTEEKAQFEANREKYTRLFRQYVEQHSEPLDWKNKEQEKWCVSYNHLWERLIYQKDFDVQGAGIYGSSEEVMQEAVEFVGRENFLRYIIGVEENNGD